MRYRPFGISGKAVSSVSVSLRPTVGFYTSQAWRNLLFSAMENGVNCFDIAAGCETLELGVAEALQAVERRLIFLICTVEGDPRRPLTAEHLATTLRDGLKRTGAGFYDVLVLDQVAFAGMTAQARMFLERLRDARKVLQLGAAGDSDHLGDCLNDPLFDVLATPYNLTSEWRARRVLREAAAQGMAAIGFDVAPAMIVQPPSAKPALMRGRARREALEGVGTYAFLHETHGWSAEELCLAYALTEPSLATLQLGMPLMHQIEGLCAVADKDPPTGLGAQVEMARFGDDAGQRNHA